MKDVILQLLKESFACCHKNALLDTNEGYCPDCGAYLKKYFYVLRCSCCDIKREAKVHFGEILPGTRFCKNCGCEKFYIEKFEILSFVDINYAIHKKEVIEISHSAAPYSQVWSEKPEKLHLLQTVKNK